MALTSFLALWVINIFLLGIELFWKSLNIAIVGRTLTKERNNQGFGYLQDEELVIQDEWSARIANRTLNGLNSD
jgi:hypothetical protein